MNTYGLLFFVNGHQFTNVIALYENVQVNAHSNNKIIHMLVSLTSLKDPNGGNKFWSSNISKLYSHGGLAQNLGTIPKWYYNTPHHRSAKISWGITFVLNVMVLTTLKTSQLMLCEVLFCLLKHLLLSKQLE